MTSQTEAFINGEGDAWFRRNHTVSQTGSHEREWEKLVFSLINPLGKGEKLPGCLLEIGTSSGSRLVRVKKYLNIPAVGIDPSTEAIREAEKVHGSEAEFIVGVAQKIPLSDQSVSVLFFGFCLYLIPEKEIAHVFTEARRVLHPGGWLAILDFDADSDSSRPYKHRPGIMSFRRDYLSILRGNRFQLVTKLPLRSDENPESIGWEVAESNRVAIWLFKDRRT